MTALVHSPLHFHRAGRSLTVGALAYLRAHSCTSPAIIPGALCLGTKGASRNSRIGTAEQEQQSVPTHTWAPWPEQLLPAGSAPGALSACSAQGASPNHSHTERAQRSLLHGSTYSTINKRETGQRRLGEPWELAGDCGNSSGWEQRMSIIAYVSLHLHRVGGDSTRVLWPLCKVTVVRFWTHRASPFQPEQREQGG